MNIEQIDKNLASLGVKEPDVEWISSHDSRFSLHGVSYNKEYNLYERVPREVALTVSKSVASLSLRTSGGRLRFTTDSDKLALKVYFDRMDARSIMSLQASAGFDVYLEQDGKEVFLTSVYPPVNAKDGFSTFVSLPEG